MQQLNVNLSIPIPSDSVLIKKVELEELKKETLSGVYWNMKDLEQRIGRKHEWIKDNILYPSRFRRILDLENGGFVYYPNGRGQNWSFQSVKMYEFLVINFYSIIHGYSYV